MATQNKTLAERNKGYCTLCRHELPISKFLKSNSDLNSNGKMSVCSDCLNEYFSKLYKLRRGYGNNFTVDATNIQFDTVTEEIINETCQKFDICFNYGAYESLISHIETEITNGRTPTVRIFGIYKSKLESTGNKNGASGLTYEYSDRVRSSNSMNETSDVMITKEDMLDLKRFWGSGFEDEDYIFLEEELARWKGTHKSDTQSEITLLREICITILETRIARSNGNSTKDLKKEMQDLMKTAAVDPSKANAASAGQGHDRYSQWIEDTENYEPAEYFEDKDLFEDYDGLMGYINKYIYRPIKNLLTDSRDFDLGDDD